MGDCGHSHHLPQGEPNATFVISIHRDPFVQLYSLFSHFAVTQLNFYLSSSSEAELCTHLLFLGAGLGTLHAHEHTPTHAPTHKHYSQNLGIWVLKSVNILKISPSGVGTTQRSFKGCEEAHKLPSLHTHTTPKILAYRHSPCCGCCCCSVSVPLGLPLDLRSVRLFPGLPPPPPLPVLPAPP